MPTPDILRKLLTTPGPSGYETPVATVWREAAAAFADVSADVVGSSVARVRGTAGGPLTAVIGHIDEIGVIVTHIDDDGFLRFEGVGGWDPIILVGQRVKLLTKGGERDGVIGKKPIHLMKADDRKNVPELKDLHIDIGARDGDEARSLTRVGDVAVIAGEPIELPNDRVVSRAMDNRIGAFVAFEVARLVAEAGGAPGDVAAVAAVQEETNLVGSRTSVFSLRPQVAVVVDVTFATDQPGISLGELSRQPFGSGPSITRGSMIHPLIAELLIETAEEQSIPFTISAAGRATGTDGDVVHLTRGGIPTAVVSVPLRYMHSPVEMVQLDDVHNTAKLIAAFTQKLTADTSLLR
ncbi:M42 family metallopeptidase [Conexibacter sp. JD483]|uniref:M42 family metallopeptidase n=1 Tax=unclassified Conexibacter TaxID=2627773 RepID=UPI00271DF95F|nr:MULTISPECIES: M42 family metallopeptidase [unclassified Conexibacter]MDO8186214.1 M42 family metallopeptidase [Conexibacter sp. CPCC 205706]MDO8199719.1 M42 family metallopeptidase [Conexibacter sp. CPCC 205762]MDR9368189.1 M42 family metallopeptidase [Conexibacter sp. JD483]